MKHVKSYKLFENWNEFDAESKLKEYYYDYESGVDSEEDSMSLMDFAVSQGDYFWDEFEANMEPEEFVDFKRNWKKGV